MPKKTLQEDKKFIYMPLLPLRGLVVFPNMILHLDASRAISVKAIEEAMVTDQNIFLVSQIAANVEKPGFDDFYKVGTIAKVKQLLKLPNNTIRVLVEGLQTARLNSFVATEPYFRCELEWIETEKPKRVTKNYEALVRRVLELFEDYFALNNHIAPDTLLSITAMNQDMEQLSYVICANLNVPNEVKQQLLETKTVKERLERLIKILIREIEITNIERQIQKKVKENIDQNQKEYFLREQLKVIQSELGDREDIASEVDEYREKLKNIQVSEENGQKIEKEIGRLYKMPPGSHEATVVRTYLDTVFELPWNAFTKENIDLEKCRKILDKDHYGLSKVKDRIVEYLAVRKKNENSKSVVLCLVGPPGVGKTSIASSVARAVNRNFVRLSLGGVRDEADIRGHRRTYIGAMPGRIINAVRQAKSSNPLILLDEIDKMASDFRGDPAAAMLEVLDKEQNHSFRDHFLELPFDLSKVMFITTANTTSTIPPALLDRMEVIELSSYTCYEKMHIAKEHLLPKQLKENGVSRQEISVDKSALWELINYYTIESGVRNLEREIGTLIRKAICDMELDGKEKVRINGKNLSKYMGPRKYIDQIEIANHEAGVATGLAYTSYGGTLLNIEVNVLDGTGKIELTGHLGDVMKESASAAVCYIRSKAEQLGVEKDFYKTKDIHVHVPEGATPKDGPSAGITMATAVVSALTGRPIRSDIAMTGEVTIRGRVLAIGGLKEKSLAAHRHNIKNIIIPYDNQKDTLEIEKELPEEFHFIPVKTMDEVLENALEKDVVQ
jgi:endopeptidase La